MPEFNQVLFDKDFLPSIKSIRIKSIQDSWIGLEHWETSLDAEDSELEAINKFIECLGKDAIQDDSKLIKLVIDARTLTVKDFYGPALFKREHPDSDDPDELIILFGENQIPVSMSNGDFIAGELKGSLSEREINDKQYPCIQFISSDDSWEFTLPLKTIEKECSKAELRPLIKRSDEFLAKIMNIPKERGNFLKLPELGECEILVKGIESAHTQYGTRYYLELDHKIYTQSNKGLTAYLAKSHKKINVLLEQGKPITLKVWDIAETQAGNPYCQAMIYVDSPRPELEWGYLQSQALSPDESGAIPAQPILDIQAGKEIPF